MERLLRMPLQRDVQMHRVRGKMLQVLFELGDLLVNLFPQQGVAMQILGNQIPRQFDGLRGGHGNVAEGCTEVTDATVRESATAGPARFAGREA